MRILKYQLIKDYCKEDFEGKINKLISKGWQPFGSPSVTRNGDYIQAMVLYDLDKKK